MSESEGRRPGLELPKLDALEAAVARALKQLEVWRERAVASEKERRRLEQRLEESAESDAADAGELEAELERLREENQELRSRLQEGRKQAEKLAREVEFLEDSR